MFVSYQLSSFYMLIDQLMCIDTWNDQVMNMFWVKAATRQ